MLPTDFAREVIPYGVAIVFAVQPLLFVVLVAARLTRRRIPRWLAALLPILAAIWLGYALLVSDELPLVRAAALIGVALSLLAVTSLRGWIDAAGLVLVAAGLPWGLYAGAWLLDGIVAGQRIDAGAALPPFVTSVVAMVIGISFVRFHRGYAAHHPQPPPADAATAPLGRRRSSGQRTRFPRYLAADRKRDRGSLRRQPDLRYGRARSADPRDRRDRDRRNPLSRGWRQRWPGRSGGHRGPAAPSRHLRGSASGSSGGSETSSADVPRSR